MPHFNFIDIGTSDFDYTIPNNGDSGIYIEPISFYLNSIPDFKNCFKENCAISDVDGYVEIYYIKPEDIKKYNLPPCLRGCNSILKPHPSVSKELELKNIDKSELVLREKVKSLQINQIYKKYDVASVDIIKIDTEGYDCHIVKQIIKSNIHPKVLRFESNELADTNLINETVELLLENGFTQKYRTNIDTCFIKIGK